jgi:hypothetical protein
MNINLTHPVKIFPHKDTSEEKKLIKKFPEGYIEIVSIEDATNPDHNVTFSLSHMGTTLGSVELDVDDIKALIDMLKVTKKIINNYYSDNRFVEEIRNECEI